MFKRLPLSPITASLTLLVLLVSFQYTKKSCVPPAKCEQERTVNFRGVAFQYPLIASDVLEFPGKTRYEHLYSITKDSVAPGISVRYYLKFGFLSGEIDDSLGVSRSNPIYAASFFLFGDQFKSDEDILQELRKGYPGEFEYFEEDGEKFYINQGKCLTVLFKRDLFFVGNIPVVSFCYRFNRERAIRFGVSTGDYN